MRIFPSGNQWHELDFPEMKKACLDTDNVFLDEFRPSNLNTSKAQNVLRCQRLCSIRDSSVYCRTAFQLPTCNPHPSYTKDTKYPTTATISHFQIPLFPSQQPHSSDQDPIMHTSITTNWLTTTLLLTSPFYHAKPSSPAPSPPGYLVLHENGVCSVRTARHEILLYCC